MVASGDSSERLDWREEYAYTQGVQAFVFGFPWMYLPTLRYLWTTVPRDPVRTPYAPLNQFWHMRNLTDASYRDGGSPNNDTLYSIAWLDVSSEPVILTHPDMGERYFTFELAGIDSDNFAYAGMRATGSAAGSFAIIGPGWDGELPAGVAALPASRTSAVLVMGRTLVDGPDDVPNVTALQDQYFLTPVSLWGTDEAAPDNRDVWPPFSADADALASWKTMNKAMAENPPGRHDDIVNAWSGIGLGPGLDVDAQDDATKRGLARASVAGRELIGAAMLDGLGTVRNGWRFPPPTFGRAGDGKDFLLRAAVQCLGGIIANDPVESIYPTTAVDSAGNALAGGESYEIHFKAGELPPVGVFWSLTLYSLDTNFVDNPINRYSIGDRTPGVAYNDDGGLTLNVQSRPPATGDSNWLPSPPSEPFYLVLRLYLPKDEAVNGTWAPPPVQILA